MDGTTPSVIVIEANKEGKIGRLVCF